ncbi:DUF4270 family protein [Spirosoma taeanense]|uniref:DUF4270 family protein n=1 Tax=Spirosoma taeanense TaxID=2735870 RepID=A0A6M5Y5L2_9BACT|nr:DUF4270 family protein [Spirosoma taeanense]QJW88650.1 DUF4270 family protein [Spirosoma taeanense]
MSRNAITTSTRNWLGRIFLLAGAVAGVLACEEPKEIGLPPTTPVDVTYSDTLSVVRQTVRFDSVASSDQSNLMVGRYSDPVLGRTQASAYVELSQYADFVVTDSATSNVTAASRIVYDSTRLFLDYDQFYYGDTTQTQEIQVFRLTDSLRTATTYDISSTIPAQSQPLVRQTIRPRPNTTDSLSFRLPLPDAYGRELLTLANTDAGKIANPALFRAQALRGLLLTTGPNERAAILGFSRGSAVVVYYHVTGEKRARFQPFLLGGKRFNHITADRSGTPLAGLQRGQVLPASATNGRTFVQPATGVTTKLVFPGLDQIRKDKRVAINRAELVITFTPTSNALLYLPAYLVLSEIDGRNHLLRTSPNRIAQLVPESQNLFDRTESSWITAPQVAIYNSRIKNYTFELSGYFQSIMANTTPNNGLAILTPSTATLNTLPSQAFYLNDRILQAILDGSASAKLIMFYTTSN